MNYKLDENTIIFMPFDNSPTENLGSNKATINNNGTSIIQGTPPPILSKKYTRYPCLSCPTKKYIYWSGQNLNNWFNTTNDFTFEYWIYVSAIHSSRQWFNYGLEAKRNGQWVLYNENFEWGISPTGENNKYPIGGSIGDGLASANKWNHCAVSRKENDWYSFFNGKLISHTNSSNSLYTGSDCTIMLGSIDDAAPQSYFKYLRISNIARYTKDFDPNAVSRGYNHFISSQLKIEQM